MSPYDAALYIHIPYCSQKCDYCDFYSETDYSGSSDTITMIGQQIADDKRVYGIDHFLSVYIGGGTPGSLSPDLMAPLLSRIKEENGGFFPREVTLECNPENITPEALSLWQEAGVNRISLGIQTFQDQFLIQAGRNSSRKKILQALKFLSRAQGIIVSLDLIQGLPGMNREDQMADLKEALSFDPDHLSWYTLSLEKGTVLADNWEKRQSLNLDSEESGQIWQDGCLLLDQAGYERYEVSNFAHPGRICEHNTAYWKMKPYLGCGPGAVSMVRNLQDRVQRHRIVQGAAAYGEGMIRLDDVETPGIMDFMKDYLLMGLRMASGIDCVSFQKIFGKNPEALFPRSLVHLRQGGMMRASGEGLRTTPKGLDMLNSILITLFEELDEWNFSGSVNWPLRSLQHS